MTHNTHLNVGLIGLGNMGQNHLRILSMLREVKLSLIYDTDYKKSEQLAQTYNTQCAETLNAFTQSNLDAVIIATPTSTHADIIKAIAPAVRNIFIEKPMGGDVVQANAIKNCVSKENLHLQVGFIERFNPAVLQLKQILDQSSKVIQVDFTRTNKLSARITDVDVITDLMIHDIDLALHINGDIQDIHAYGYKEGKHIAFANAILTHENGRFSRILASRMTEKKIRRIEATCENIYVDCELMRKEIIVNKQSEIIQNKNDAYRITALQENIEVKPQEALLLELQAFLHNCTAKNQDSRLAAPSANDALQALEICGIIQQKVDKNV